MRKSVNYLFSLLVIFFLFACEKEIDLNISGQPKLVVNALFNPDSVWAIHVSRSVLVISQSPPPPVNEATIQLYEDGVLLEELTGGVNGMYKSSVHKPVTGKTYQIQVQEPTLGQAEATEIMEVEKVKILQARYVNVRDANLEYSISITFKDPAEAKNFYVVNIYSVDEKGIIYQADVRSDDIAAANKEVSAIGVGFSDELFNGKEYTYQLKLFYPYSKLIIALQNVSPAYYQYHYTHQGQGSSLNDPFSTPSELYTNISNGLGIFASYQSDTISVLPQ